MLPFLLFLVRYCCKWSCCANLVSPLIHVIAKEKGFCGVVSQAPLREMSKNDSGVPFSLRGLLGDKAFRVK